MGHFGPKNGMPSKLWIHSKDFFKILHNERDQEVHGTYINGFPEKILILVQMDYFGLKIAHCNNEPLEF